jgi:F0F1-type ATP synthase beta subunit
MLHDNHTFFI